MTKLLQSLEALRLQHERKHNSMLKLVQKILGPLQIYKHLCNGCVLVTSPWSVCVCQCSYRGKRNRQILLLKFQYRNLLFQCWRGQVKHIVHGCLITSFGQRTLGVWRETECAGDPHNSISRPFKGRFAFLTTEWLCVLRYLVCQLLQDCFKLMTQCSVKM